MYTNNGGGRDMNTQRNLNLTLESFSTYLTSDFVVYKLVVVPGLSTDVKTNSLLDIVNPDQEVRVIID